MCICTYLSIYIYKHTPKDTNKTNEQNMERGVMTCIAIVATTVRRSITPAAVMQVTHESLTHLPREARLRRERVLY